MPKFIITHGSVLLPKENGKQKALTVGEEIELTEEQRKHIDPTGMQFVTPAVFEQMKKSAEAHVALEAAAKAESENPKAKPQAISAKTLKAIAELKPAAPAPAPVAKKEGGK